jgi:hypothetical protein
MRHDPTGTAKYIVKEGGNEREREENKSMKDFIKEGERR